MKNYKIEKHLNNLKTLNVLHIHKELTYKTIKKTYIHDFIYYFILKQLIFI